MSYSKNFKILMINEGVDLSPSNTKYDKGGATEFGIASKIWSKEYAEITSLKTYNEKIDYASKFYRKEFWDIIQGDKIDFENDLLALHLFDMSVNHGIIESVKMLQEIIKITIPSTIIDGKVGKQVLIGIHVIQNNILSAKYIQARVDCYENLTSDKLKNFKDKKANDLTINTLEAEKELRYIFEENQGWINRVHNTDFYYKTIKN